MCPGKNDILLRTFFNGQGDPWTSVGRNEFVIADGQTIDLDVYLSRHSDVKVLDANSPEGKRRLGLAMAIARLSELVSKEPDDIDALSSRADVLVQVGAVEAAIADYEQCIKLEPTGFRGVMIYNNLAFILATTPDDKLRDGRRAIALSNNAKTLQQKSSFDVLDTMAAAYAEAGEFDTAIKTQKEAIDLAPEGQRENCGEILKLYESQQPRRESTSENEQPE